MTTPAFRAFLDKFKIAELTVRRYQYWTWSVRPIQGTLGASIISLNRPAVVWSEVTINENAELTQIITDVESTLRSTFAYQKINYLMLMMVDDHVHFHVFPRYSENRLFAGKTWVDTNWPKPPDLLSGDSEAMVLTQVLYALQK